jgi:hypothetical protein
MLENIYRKRYSKNFMDASNGNGSPPALTGGLAAGLAIGVLKG